MASPDILFKGIPRGPSRGYTADVLRALPKVGTVAIPCAGTFSLPVVAKTAGVVPSQVFCGDVSLYSHALGHAIMGEDFKLELKDDTGLDYLKPLLKGGPIQKAAAVLYSIRVLQYHRKKKTPHWDMLRRELVENAGNYIVQLEEQIEGLQSALGGLTYRSQDLWVTLEQYANDPDNVILVDPPRYTGGYEAQFSGVAETWDWDEPEFKSFTDAHFPDLMTFLADKPALSLMYYMMPEDPSPFWGEPWRAVFADRPGARRGAMIHWIVANRSPIDLGVSRPIPSGAYRQFPLFNDECEIGPDSELRAMRLDKPTGEHYRDLLIHRLEGGQAEVYIGLFLDGRIFGVVGVSSQGILMVEAVGSDEQMTGYVTFHFTVRSERYNRIHKLALMSLASEWLWEEAFAHTSWFSALGAPTRMETSMLTDHPVVMTARGVFRLLSREDGTPPHKYRLIYEADIAKRTPEDTLGEFLKKWPGGKKA